MKRTTKALLVGVGGVGASLAFLALTVYPFQYGPVESALLVGGLLLFALIETVLDDASI